MKKTDTVENTYCDICESERAHGTCIICKRDLCEQHCINLSIMTRSEWSPSTGVWVSLCPKDAMPLIPLLNRLQGELADKPYERSLNYLLKVINEDGEK